MHKSITLQNFQRLALYFFVFSIFIETWDPLNTGIDYLNTKLTISLYLLLTLFNYKSFYTLKKTKYFLTALVALFILNTLMSYLNVNSTYSEYFNFSAFLHIVLLIVITNHFLIDRNVLPGVLNSYIYGGILLTAFFILNIGTKETLEGRFTIMGFNQNQLAVNLSILIMLILWPAIKEYKNIYTKSFISKAFFLPLIFAFLSSTGSRSGILSLTLGLITLFVFKPSVSFSKKITTLFAGAIFLSIIFFFFSSNQVVSERALNSVNEGDMSGRDLRWIAIFDMFLKHPIAGIGSTGYSSEIEFALGYKTSPHNLFLETIVLTGLIGLSILFIFLARIIKALIKIRKLTSNQLPLALFMPIMVTAFVGHPFGLKITYIIFAFIICEYTTAMQSSLNDISQNPKSGKIVSFM